MGPEAKLYKKLKTKTPRIIWTRIENLSKLGTPDLLGYNTSGHFFTVELKVTRGNKLKFSPHQIAFHVAHPHNTFIIAEALGPRLVKLFPGSMVLVLVFGVCDMFNVSRPAASTAAAFIALSGCRTVAA